MKKGTNTNRPEKGSHIAVEPIKSLKDIKTIKTNLANRPRDLALFTLGINSALRASDLIRITAGQVRHLKPGDELALYEQKTGKARRINLNKAGIDSLQALLKSRSYQDDQPLFTGQRGCLTVPSIHRLVKSWCKAINLKGNYGSHSLRKSFGFHQRVTFGVDIPTLMEIFNHSTQRQTLKYLGVQPREIKSVYENQL